MYPLSLRNERAVMETLLELVESKLKLYPTTLAQDRRLLGQATSSGSGDCESASTSTTTASSSEGGGGGGAMSLPPFSNKRHAVIQVAGEKEVLELLALVEFARQARAAVIAQGIVRKVQIAHFDTRAHRRS